MSKPTPKQKSPRVAALETATQLTSTTRNAQYGAPLKNLSCAAALRAVYKEYAGEYKYSPAHDAAIEQVMLKLARIATGQTGNAENYIDGAAYFAIAHECQELS